MNKKTLIIPIVAILILIMIMHYYPDLITLFTFTGDGTIPVNGEQMSIGETYVMESSLNFDHWLWTITTTKGDTTYTIQENSFAFAVENTFRGNRITSYTLREVTK